MFATMTAKLMTMISDQTIQLGKADDYELVARIGCGRYGEVFEAINVSNNKRVAIKALKPVRIDKVIREINILKCLNGAQYVIPLKDIIINNGITCLVFPFVSNQTLKTVGPNLTDLEVRHYLYKLLKAIDIAHKHNIIHRDIKPSNVVIDRNRKLLRLVDWGLADFHQENKAYSVTVASRHYKAPELLCNYSKYDFSLDMWSFGCVMAGLIFKKEPFFNGLDNLDQLKTICLVLGTQGLRDYVKKYKLNAITIKSLLDTNLKARHWTEFVMTSNESLANNIAIDLIEKLVVFDHKFRLNAEEALSHPFFDTVRNNKNSITQ